jgi:hypothetical protein
MKRILLIVAPLMIGACQTKAAVGASDQPQPQQQVHDNFSLSSLNDAANLLMTVSDAGTRTPCNVTPEQALAWMNSLHSLMDEQIMKESEAALKDPKGWAARNKIESCEKRCECGIWVNVLENAPKAMTRNKVDVIRQKAAKQSPQQLQACAEAKGAWFCSSPLRERLENASKH